MSRAAWAGAALLVLGYPGGAWAQQPLRGGLVDSPRVGRPAPALVLPYFTVDGAGPADQPFRLEAELGRVVVLVFDAGIDSTAAAGWADVGRRAGDLPGRTTIVVGVHQGRAARVAELAVAAGPGVKLLADSAGRARRAYGIRPVAGGWNAFVVADDGRLVWSGPVDPGQAETWAGVVEGIRKGRTALGSGG